MFKVVWKFGSVRVIFEACYLVVEFSILER